MFVTELSLPGELEQIAQVLGTLLEEREESEYSGGECDIGPMIHETTMKSFINSSSSKEKRVKSTCDTKYSASIQLYRVYL